MEKQKYIDSILKILDDAASDTLLTTRDYADLCGEIADDADTRYRAAEEDLAEQEDTEISFF